MENNYGIVGFKLKKGLKFMRLFNSIFIKLNKGET